MTEETPQNDTGEKPIYGWAEAGAYLSPETGRLEFYTKRAGAIYRDGRTENYGSDHGSALPK